MKITSLETLIGAACIAVGLTTPISAMPLDFEFSFSDGTHTFFGLVKGLEDNAIGAAAQVEVTSGTWGVGAGIFTQRAGFNNLFEVVAGDIISADYGGLNDDWGGLYLTGLDGVSRSSVTVPGTFGGTVGGPTTYTAVSAVPLPAGGLMLLSGLIGTAALRRRKSSKV